MHASPREAGEGFGMEALVGHGARVELWVSFLTRESKQM